MVGINPMILQETMEAQELLLLEQILIESMFTSLENPKRMIMDLLAFIEATMPEQLG